MSERERLIELIGSKVCENYSPNCDENTLHSCEQCYANDCKIGDMADYLLENGVVVLPCKVGDTVYRISVKATSKIKYIQKTTISRIAFDNEGVWLFCSCNPISRSVFGKNIFLTKEEAEQVIQALKGGNENE